MRSSKAITSTMSTSRSRDTAAERSGASCASRARRGITFMTRQRCALLLAAMAAVACRPPRAAPLTGDVAPVTLPATALPPVHQKIVFHFAYRDPELQVRGDGVARIAPPDSVRLDFFVNNEPAGYATLIGDTLRVPNAEKVARQLLPPIPLLWATLGRLHVPALRDTAARVDGDTLRVDIGMDPRWRAAFTRGALRRLEFIDGGRIPQRVTRNADGDVHYEHTTARRTLDLTPTRVDTVSAFDATIWY